MIWIFYQPARKHVYDLTIIYKYAVPCSQALGNNYDFLSYCPMGGGHLCTVLC